MNNFIRVRKEKTERNDLAHWPISFYNESTTEEVNKSMADQQQLDLLRQGVTDWHAWRTQHPDIQPNLSGAQLSGAQLSRAHLSYADLSRAQLSGANLSEADLSRAQLSG